MSPSRTAGDTRRTGSLRDRDRERLHSRGGYPERTLRGYPCPRACASTRHRTRHRARQPNFVPGVGNLGEARVFDRAEREPSPPPETGSPTRPPRMPRYRARASHARRPADLRDRLQLNPTMPLRGRAAEGCARRPRRRPRQCGACSDSRSPGPVSLSAGASAPVRGCPRGPPVATACPRLPTGTSSRIIRAWLMYLPFPPAVESHNQ